MKQSTPVFDLLETDKVLLKTDEIAFYCRTTSTHHRE